MFRDGSGNPILRATLRVGDPCAVVVKEVAINHLRWQFLPQNKQQGSCKAIPHCFTVKRIVCVEKPLRSCQLLANYERLDLDEEAAKLMDLRTGGIPGARFIIKATFIRKKHIFRVKMLKLFRLSPFLPFPFPIQNPLTIKYTERYH